MESYISLPRFTKVIMTAVYTGILGTLLAMAYDLYYVKTLHFPLSEIINVATIIFAVNLLFFAIGFIFYGMISSFKGGETVFIVLFIALTLMGISKASGVHRTDDPVVNIQFRHLLSGIIIIMGVLAAVIMPILFHNRKFEQYFI